MMGWVARLSRILSGSMKLQKALAVALRHAVFGIPGEALVDREMHARRRLLPVGRVVAVADAVVLVQVDVVHAAIVRGHGGDHAVGLGVLMVDVLTQAVPQLGDMFLQRLHLVGAHVGPLLPPIPGSDSLVSDSMIVRQLAQVAVDLLRPGGCTAGQNKRDRDADAHKEGAGDADRPRFLVDLVLIPGGVEVRGDHAGHLPGGIEHRAVGAVKRPHASS